MSPRPTDGARNQRGHLGCIAGRRRTEQRKHALDIALTAARTLGSADLSWWASRYTAHSETVRRGGFEAAISAASGAFASGRGALMRGHVVRRQRHHQAVPGKGRVPGPRAPGGGVRRPLVERDRVEEHDLTPLGVGGPLQQQGTAVVERDQILGREVLVRRPVGEEADLMIAAA